MKNFGLGPLRATMTDPKLAELPIEKEYSENINKQMRVPQSIR